MNVFHQNPLVALEKVAVHDHLWNALHSWNPSLCFNPPSKLLCEQPHYNKLPFHWMQLFGPGVDISSKQSQGVSSIKLLNTEIKNTISFYCVEMRQKVSENTAVIFFCEK